MNKTHFYSAAICIAVLLISSTAWSADHIDSPAAVTYPHADIGDFYAWHTPDGKLNAIITFYGMSNSPQGNYNADILYGVHIDYDGDNMPNRDIWVRFGQNGMGAWGVQVENLPGAVGPVVGGVQATIDGGGGTSVFAGAADDPFFFDFEGYQTTLQTATLSFDSNRDSFAGTNVTVIALQMDLAQASNGQAEFSIWATTRRK